MKFRRTLGARARATIATIAAMSLLAVAIPTAAYADPIVPTLSGTVTLDTNASGVVDAATADGFVEAGVAGVQIDVICVATGTSILTTTSDAAGAWSFENFDLAADQLNCPDGIVQVRSTVTDSRYSITNAAGDNQTPRTGNEQVGLSAPITLTDVSAEMVNTLTRPDWYLDLTIPTDAGTGSPAVYTGSGPFDSGCPEAGHDCSADDTTVRSADLVTFTWAVTASSLDDLSPTLTAVILEQRLELVGGAIANFARIPARCKPTAGGGADPASVIVDQDGNVIAEGEMPPAGTTSVTLKCNLGTWSQTGDAVTLQPVVRVSAESPNGSTFTTTAGVYAVDANSVPTAVPADTESFGPVDITAAPAYELEKKGFFNQDPGYYDIGRGSEPGWWTYAVIQVKTNRKVGVEALAQPITITEDVFGYLPDGVTPNPGMEFVIAGCMPNPNAWGGLVGGSPAPYYNFTDPRTTVRDSGTCTYQRNDPSDLTSDYTLTFDGIDMSGATYPTLAAGGVDLSAGPYYVASYRVAVFIPYKTLDATNGVLGDNTGGMSLYNAVGDFDPDGVSGTNNFGAGVEPGYCDGESLDGLTLAEVAQHCDPSGTNTGTPSKSDNLVGPTSLVMAPGQFAKYLLNQSTMYSGAWSPLPNMTAAHDGQGVLQPGQVADTHLNWINAGQASWHNSQICDVFDNTVGVLVPSTATVTGGSANTYAWLSATGPGTGDYASAQEAIYNSKWIFEYGHIDVTGDDPLVGGLSPTSGQYVGDWTNQGAARCDDDSAQGGWFTDPNSVPGGLDEVNAIRVRPGIDPATGLATTQDFAVNNRLNFGMQIRDSFYTGPHDGESIPAGTVFANFGAVKSDEGTGGTWTARYYNPSPENTATDGDRVTIARATLAIQKRTITVDGVGDGAAEFGTTGNAVAGNQIVWEVVSSVQATSNQPAPVSNLQITDVLPEFADYDPDCTATIAGGTPADIVEYDTPSAGKTTLTWNLGSWTPNTPVPNRRICTASDPLAPNGTSLVNHAEIKYTGSPIEPFDDHTVTLEQTGEIKLRKTVDAPLDVLNDDQNYTLSMQNFSETLTVGAPTFIEVFPYNGDATPPGGVNRSPSSNFHGDLTLTGPATVQNISGGSYAGTFLYSTDAPATINQNLNLNTSTWVTAASLGGDYSQVTAIKFIGDDNLTPVTTVATSGLTVAFTLQAGDTSDPFSATANAAGDRYSDRFTAFSSTFGGAGGTFQVLASNRVTVRTVSHSNGDLIFEDRDGDGLYTAGRDLLVPDGVTVNLYYEGAGGDVLVHSTTTSGGTYLFTKLPAGTYHIEIPASEFASGGLLNGYTLTVAPASGSGETNVDENDDVSHDTVNGTGGSLISNSFTLSATVNPTTKAVTGDEPTGENIHGITDSTTTDPFSNLAIDLAVQQAPGIDIEKEVCTIADNSCDPAAALGAGGWSVDGVSGVGPATETTLRPYGSAVLWRIIVTNTGNQYLTDVEVTDAVTPDCAATATDVADFADFAPAAVATYTCETAAITANITPNTADVVGTPEGTDETLTDIDTANATTTGSLVINKLITGPGGEAYGTGPFTFSVVCTLASAEVVNTTITLTPTAGATSVTSDPITGIPLGASCVVTETDDGGADSTPAPVTVQIVDNDQANTVTAELTNAFSQGTLELNKVVDGTAADKDYVKNLEFDILVTCQVETEDDNGDPIIGTVYSGTVTLMGGETVAIEDANGDPLLLPLGTHCFGEETNDGGATSASIDFDSFDNAAVIVASDSEQHLSITATNTFDDAEIIVKKLVVGLGSAGPYTFTLVCETAGGEEFPLDAEDAQFELSHNETRTITVLVGVTCTVTELASKGAIVSVVDTDSTTAGGSHDGVVVATAETQNITVTNTFATAIESEHPLALTGQDLRGRLLLGGVVGGSVLLLGVGLILLARRRRRKQHS